MFYNRLLAEIRPENKLFSIFCPFPWLMVQGDGSATPAQCCRQKGAGRMLSPKHAGAGEKLQQRWEGVWLFSQQQKLISAGKLEVRRARQTSQAGFHSHE